MFSTIKDRYNRYKRYKATVAELSYLTDRDLSDVGIHRSQIHQLARDVSYS